MNLNPIATPARPVAHHAALKCLAVAALLAGPHLAQAAGIVDATGDFLPSFAGSITSGDLDVLSASVAYNNVNNTFILSSTMNGAIGSTPKGFYVWGVNRGAGTAGFLANGITGVLFDRVVLLRPDGTGSIGGGPALPAGSITISGNTITGVVSASLLPGTGFATADYTWNLWPRDGAFTGFAAISDFAPDNSNFPAAAVPEPTSVALLLAGLGVLGWRVRASKAG